VDKRMIRRLARQPWTKELRRDADGSVFGRVVELPGCMTSGADEAEALQRLDVALELWLETELELGHTIPQPLPPTLKT